MTLPILRARQQPQTPAALDYGNPLTRGLFCALVPANGPVQTISFAPIVPRLDHIDSPAEFWTYAGGGGRPTFVLPAQTGAEWTFAAVGIPIDTTGFRVLANFFDSANTGTVLHTLYSRAFSSANAGAYSSIYQTGFANGSTAWPANQPNVIGAAFSGAANLGALYFDRRRESTFSLSATTSCTVDRVEMATRQGSDASSSGNAVALICAWNRALGFDEWRQFAENPWQIYAPIVRRTYFSVVGPAAATLSAPTATAGSTSATIGATTDQASGTLYAVADTAANLSGVTAAQIKAGQKAGGSAALAANSAAVSTTTPSVGVTGLSATTLYSFAAVQNNANGDSNVVTGTFTTLDPPITQSRYRWRNDDGSETTATWAAVEDADISVAALTAKRLRVQVAATGDPSAKSFKLQYRKVGDGTWRDIN